jgi:hypothetical protein
MSSRKSTKESTGVLKSLSAASINPRPLPKIPHTEGYAVSWERLRTAYTEKTPTNIKALDAYLLYCFVTGILQFVYCLSTRGKNYQAFLGGFIACVGSFVLTGKNQGGLK